MHRSTRWEYILKPLFIKHKDKKNGILNLISFSIFVCFVTVSVHLDLVSELTTNAFIATLKSCISRRRKCARIFSNNAKNCAGANAKLQRFHYLLRPPEERLTIYLTLVNITWTFILLSDYFFGLWEARIKSVKYHLKWLVGNTKLTLEELVTVVTQVELILYSRPNTLFFADV